MYRLNMHHTRLSPPPSSQSIPFHPKTWKHSLFIDVAVTVHNIDMYILETCFLSLVLCSLLLYGKQGSTGKTNMMSFKYYLRAYVTNCIPETSDVLTFSFFLWFMGCNFQRIVKMVKFNRCWILKACLCDLKSIGKLAGFLIISLKIPFFLNNCLWEVHWVWLFWFWFEHSCISSILSWK